MPKRDCRFVVFALFIVIGFLFAIISLIISAITSTPIDHAIGLALGWLIGSFLLGVLFEIVL